MKAVGHLYLRAWCPNSNFRQTCPLHHIGKAKAVKPSPIYYQFQFVELNSTYSPIGARMKYALLLFVSQWVFTKNVSVNSNSV